MYIQTFIYIHTHTYIHPHTYVCKYICMCIYINVCMYMIFSFKKKYSLLITTRKICLSHQCLYVKN